MFPSPTRARVALLEDQPAPPSLCGLLAAIVDYAGLFPPAALSLEEAVRNYARFRQEDEAWMLARFVLPASLLAELPRHLHFFTREAPLPLSVLCTGDGDTGAFFRALDSDLEALLHVHRQRGGHALRVDVLEARLPAGLLEHPAALRSFLNRTDRHIEDAGLSGPTLFFEIPLDERARDLLPAMLDTMAAHSCCHGRSPVGLKVRTGGDGSEAVPPAEQLAFIIRTCRAAGVRFKATAGLHHPVRHYVPEDASHRHGFLNLFGAAVLAHAHDLDEDGLLEILTAEEAADFYFADGHFGWRDLEAPLPAVRRTRDDLAISFGSCSFDEPREHLRSLGLL